MTAKTKKILGYTFLIVLIVSLLVVGGFLTHELISPTDTLKQEAKKEEAQSKEIPEGRGANAGTGVTLNSTADTVINNFQPNNNYGNNPGMDVSHNDNPHIESKGLALFNLSSIPTNSVIDSATLKLHVSICGSPGPTMLTAAQATNPWGEMTATWASKPSYSGGVPKSSLCTTPSDHTLDVKEIVKKWVNYSEKNYGFVIHGGDSGNWDFGFCTRENNNFQLRPQLDIAYHEPTVNPPGGNQGGNNAGSSGSGNTGSTQPAGSPLGQEVAPPVFTHIIKNNEKTEAPISGVVEIKEGDEISAFGTADKNAKLKIFAAGVNGSSFDAVADESGNWLYRFDPLNVREEESAVQAQVQKDDGMTSAVTEMFQIKKVAGVKSEAQNKKLTFWQNLLGKYRWYFFGILILFLIGLTTTFIILVKKRKGSDNNQVKTD